MIRVLNSEQRYGAVSMTLHWLMALVLVVLIVMGLYMVAMPDVGFNSRKIWLILAHKEIGVLALFLAALRLPWRLGNALPHLVATIPDWQKVIARFVHLCFYALMFALPLTGWLMSSASGISVSVLGWFKLPDLVPHNDSLFRTYIQLHKWLSYALIAFLFAHSGAALRHHFLLKDATLKKMASGSEAASRRAG